MNKLAYYTGYMDKEAISDTARNALIGAGIGGLTGAAGGYLLSDKKTKRRNALLAGLGGAGIGAGAGALWGPQAKKKISLGDDFWDKIMEDKAKNYYGHFKDKLPKSDSESYRSWYDRLKAKEHNEIFKGIRPQQIYGI